LKEQIKILESLKAYIPKEEIDLMKEKSKAKIEAAKVLQKLIEELKKICLKLSCCSQCGFGQ